MTKKDYIKIAATLKDEKERVERDENISASKQADALVELSIITGKIAYMLQRDNPRLDRNRFLVACGYQA